MLVYGYAFNLDASDAPSCRIFLDLIRRDFITSRIWVELIWVAIFWIMEFCASTSSLMTHILEDLGLVFNPIGIPV